MKHMNKKWKDISLVIGIIFIFYAIYLTFSGSTGDGNNHTKVNILHKESNNQQSDTDSQKRYDEKRKFEKQKIVNSIQRHVLDLKTLQYEYLFQVRENIYKDIKQYQSESIKFATDITDSGSQIKILWKSTTDYFKKENQTQEYIEKLYYHYMFDEKKINKIVLNRFSDFNNVFEDNYNVMLSEIVNDIPAMGLDILEKQDIEDILNFQLELQNNTIILDEIKKGTKIATYSSLGTFFVSNFVLEPIVAKAVSSAITKITASTITSGTSATAVSSSAIGGPIAIGAAIAISLGVEWLMSNKNKVDIKNKLNSKIEEVAMSVSKSVYLDIKNRLELKFDRIY